MLSLTHSVAFHCYTPHKHTHTRPRVYIIHTPFYIVQWIETKGIKVVYYHINVIVILYNAYIGWERCSCWSVFVYIRKIHCTPQQLKLLFLFLSLSFSSFLPFVSMSDAAPPTPEDKRPLLSEDVTEQSSSSLPGDLGQAKPVAAAVSGDQATAEITRETDDGTTCTHTAMHALLTR